MVARMISLRLKPNSRTIGAGCRARGPAAEGDIMSVKSLEQEAEYVARLAITCRQQALVETASRAAEAECQRVFTLVQQHCLTCGAPAGDGHVPQPRHRQIRALSGGLAGL